MLHRRASVVRTLLITLVATLSLAASAQASVTVDLADATPADTDAAVHTDFHVRINFGGTEAPQGLVIGLPPGLVGDPGAPEKCTMAQFNSSSCPAGSKVGETTVGVLLGLPGSGSVYNLEPAPGYPATLGVDVMGIVKSTSNVRVRISDYGLDSILELPTMPQVNFVDLTLYGQTSTGKPFVTNPTACIPATAKASVTGSGGSKAEDTFTFTPTNCQKVPFTPSLLVGPKTPKADEPGAAEATLIVPDTDTVVDGKPRRQAHVDRVELVLPEGLVLSPGLANNLEPCTEEQFGEKRDEPPKCPAKSEIGEVEFSTPVFKKPDGSYDPLKGKVYLGVPKPGQKLRNFVSVEDPRLRVKLIGDVIADPQTGRLRNVFPSSPQVPFARFRFKYQADDPANGKNAVLTSPAECKEHTVSVEMTPWSVEAAGRKSPTDTFTTVDCPPPAFTPAVDASVSDPTAGADTSFTVRFTRPDRQGRLAGMKVALPAGLAGRLGAVPACPQLEARLAACPDASQVGSVKVTVGTGIAPLTLPGKVYLTDSINGGIAGLAIIVPAKAGGLDFGTVATLASIKLRPDAGIDVETEPLPQIVDGIVINYRAIDLTMDKPGFMRNATSCAAQALHVDFTGTKGETAAAETAYQPTGCEGRPYTPKLAMTLGGKGNTGKGANPALRAVLTQTEAELNSRKVAVTLPLGVSASLANLNKAACPEAQVLAGTCPAAAKIGTVRVSTPLLPYPLTGEVVLQVPSKPGLPQLSIALPQVGIRLLASTAFVNGSQLQTTFDNIPDVPITSFDLALKGGAGGVLQTTNELCGTKPVVATSFESHGGKTLSATSPVTLDGCSGAGASAAKLKVSGKLRGRTLTLTVRSPQALKSLRIKGIGKVQRPRSTKALRKAAKVKAGGKRLKKPKVAFRDGAIVLSGWSSKKGTKRVDLTLKLRKGVKKGKRLSLRLEGTPVKGKALKSTKRIAPS
ncbi:MAG: hypothetical protein HZB46_04200 [Solirubrobacterales bacterium]|nr:hypothetical protein [Solirubrobacterales bacterium]